MRALSSEFRGLFYAASFAALTAACGDGSSSAAPADSGEPPPPDDAIGCEDDARAQVYEGGLTVRGALGHWTFVLDAADPAPPAKGWNHWIVTLRDSDGSGPGAAVDILEAAPFMPDHDHGPPRAPTVEQSGDAFSIDGIDFFMPGLWRVTLTARGAAQDTADFFFCVEG